jgi:1,4-dihydroxy-2-naphthoate polyprenyltransferase
VKSIDWTALLGPMRIPFLILAPTCIAVALGTAMLESGSLKSIEVILLVIAAIAAHICVNVFNEYFDFKSGLDSRTQRTPFSGGSGTLQAHPHLAPLVFAEAVIAGGVTFLIGLYFLQLRGWGLLPVAVIGFIVAYIYTNWLSKNPVVCLVTPGVGFGLVFVMGSHYALTGTYSWTAFVASLVPFFLVSNLLLINQFPDVEADRTVGKKHFPLVIGRRKSAYIYSAFLFASYGAIVLGVVLRLFPVTALLGLLTLPMVIDAARASVRDADNIPALIPTLGLNVQITLLTPLLFAVGLLVG